jgi:hypothetical protein
MYFLKVIDQITFVLGNPKPRVVELKLDDGTSAAV